MKEKRCDNHPSIGALTACSSCGRGLCDECWRRTVDDKPWCELCLHHLTSTERGQAVTIAFALLCSTVAAVAWRWERAHPNRLHDLFWPAFAVVAIGGTAYFLLRRPPELNATIQARSNLDISGSKPSGRVGHPYRAALKQSTILVASPVSGLWTTTILLLCMVGAALAIPGVLRLPKWIEAEWVVAAWWMVWTLTLSILLFRGWRVSNDHILAPPRPPWSREGFSKPGCGDGCNSGCDLVGCSDAGGLGEALVGLVVIVVLLAAAWLFVELLLPTLFFYAYYLVRTSLARVANDRHGCEHRLGAAFGWGAFWTSLYLLPLALVIFIVHAVVQGR